MASVANKDRRGEFVTVIRYKRPHSSVTEVPKLNLFNFDTPENKGSRYILTSPRSLKVLH